MMKFASFAAVTTLAIAGASSTASAGLWSYTATCTVTQWQIPVPPAYPGVGGQFSLLAIIDDANPLVSSYQNLVFYNYAVKSVMITTAGSSTTQVAPGLDTMNWSLNYQYTQGSSVPTLVTLQAGDQAGSTGQVRIEFSMPFSQANWGIASTSGWSGQPNASLWNWGSGRFTATNIAITQGVAPAPGALALLGVAGLAGSRRRRA